MDVVVEVEVVLDEVEEVVIEVEVEVVVAEAVDVVATDVVVVLIVDVVVTADVVVVLIGAVVVVVVVVVVVEVDEEVVVEADVVVVGAVVVEDSESDPTEPQPPAGAGITSRACPACPCLVESSSTSISTNLLSPAEWQIEIFCTP